MRRGCRQRGWPLHRRSAVPLPRRGRRGKSTSVRGALSPAYPE
ncbi:MAG TPA: hypothetical protein VFU47_07595 [Armatimonadota bacterium]|nr:hypothetical protein [Armatimonadota bacterium]